MNATVAEELPQLCSCNDVSSFGIDCCEHHAKAACCCILCLLLFDSALPKSLFTAKSGRSAQSDSVLDPEHVGTHTKSASVLATDRDHKQANFCAQQRMSALFGNVVQALSILKRIWFPGIKPSWILSHAWYVIAFPVLVTYTDPATLVQTLTWVHAWW